MHTIRSIASISSLSAISQIDAIVVSIVVIIMVMASSNPFNSLLFLDCSEESSIQGPAANIFSVLSEEVKIVYYVSVFNKWDMDKEESASFARIGSRNLGVFISEPLDLIRSDTVIAVNIHAVVFSRV